MAGTRGVGRKHEGLDHSRTAYNGTCSVLATHSLCPLFLCIRTYHFQSGICRVALGCGLQALTALGRPIMEWGSSGISRCPVVRDPTPRRRSEDSGTAFPQLALLIASYHPIWPCLPARRHPYLTPGGRQVSSQLPNMKFRRTSPRLYHVKPVTAPHRTPKSTDGGG
jgi:hypothetical protein